MSENIRCPMETCSGWVCEVEDETTFWGCGECGNVWFDLDSLYDAIAEAVEKRDYRRKVYVKTDEGWAPVPLEQEPADYDELVAEEWDDQP